MKPTNLNKNTLKQQINIVLYQPEIPFNTGNILRTCVAFNASLHLIRPYGFFLNDKRMLKASTGYWELLKIQEHDDFKSFLATTNVTDEIYYLTKKATKNPDQVDFLINNLRNIYLVFGQETKGLPQTIIKNNGDKCLRIPISSNSRCLNLSNSVTCLLYEIAHQNNFNGLERKNAIKK